MSDPFACSQAELWSQFQERNTEILSSDQTREIEENETFKYVPNEMGRPPKTEHAYDNFKDPKVPGCNVDESYSKILRKHIVEIHGKNLDQASFEAIFENEVRKFKANLKISEDAEAKAKEQEEFLKETPQHILEQEPHQMLSREAHELAVNLGYQDAHDMANPEDKPHPVIANAIFNQKHHPYARINDPDHWYFYEWFNMTYPRNQ